MTGVCPARIMIPHPVKEVPCTKIDELIALLDHYTASIGYSIKPRMNEDENSFFMAKGPATSADVRASSRAAGDAFGSRSDNDAHTFSGDEVVECAICCNVPNLSDTDGE